MGNYYRILDADLNRASEGARVLEDYARLCLSNQGMSKRLRDLRHRIRKGLAFMDCRLLNHRDSVNDPGRAISRESIQDSKSTPKQLVLGNFKRIQEALRSIEETLKIINCHELSKSYEDLRFLSYELEKAFSLLIRKDLPWGIYGITAERLSGGRSNADTVLEMVKHGIGIIQYREKQKSFREKLNECRQIRKITRDNDVLFIVNDHPDICLLADADGVHLGQDDLPPRDVRAILGSRIIGISTHSPEQAEKAVKDGADYIAAGPIFQTNTKEDVCRPVGIGYLEYVLENIDLPCVAIGGIKESNIDSVLKAGARTVALVSEITGSEDMRDKIKTILGKFDKYQL